MAVKVVAFLYLFADLISVLLALILKYLPLCHSCHGKARQTIELENGGGGGVD